MKYLFDTRLYLVICVPDSKPSKVKGMEGKIFVTIPSRTT